MIEEKADRHGEQLGMIEEKADRQEGKLDRLEGKADVQEQKLDQLEQKADRQEGKLDQLEQKADRQEGKLDRLEGKADRQEGKLDQLEQKADRQEEKLDRQEEKLDRLVLPVPLEGSVATQQGNAGNISAAVTATRGSDNSVYVRAALDVPSSELDEETAWSNWEPFGRPGSALGILEVSLDLEYSEDSDVELIAMLTARDQIGNIYHRAFEGRPQNHFLDPNRWTGWETFLNQP